jgi:hypothetical protein
MPAALLAAIGGASARIVNEPVGSPAAGARLDLSFEEFVS